MNESAISAQAVAIMANISGVQASFGPTAMPKALNEADLPASVVYVGPMPTRDLLYRHAVDGIAEAQEYPVILHVSPITQGLDIAEVTSTYLTLTPLILAAFDGRPKLINATGSDPTDFDYDAADLTEAHVTKHSGLTVRPYGQIDYLAVEFTLIVDGARRTTKVADE